MQMTERHIGGVTILDLTGTITIDGDASRLKDKIDSLIRLERTSVVLHLAEISYIDKGALGQLVSCHSSLARTTGGLKLLHVGKRNRKLLSITRLVTIFKTFDSEEDAVRSFPELRADSLIPVVADR
jgi:anti-sigma B factor antagonist